MPSTKESKMNIHEFNQKYASFKDADQIQITCDCSKHKIIGEIINIGKQPAKRNIMKNGQFICRKCHEVHFNPMKKINPVRQTNEIIKVYCAHPKHEGDRYREIKMSAYFGKLEEPYTQDCKSCVQKDKEINQEQREKISAKLTGIERSDEFKKKLSDYMKNNPEGIARGQKNLFENHCTTGFLGKHHTEETKEKMSEAMSGRTYSEEHCSNISAGRKKMLEEQGGFSQEHREKISKATIQQYKEGFDPNTHHLKGKHQSPKAGNIHFRSSYEKKAYLKLDEDESVKTYSIEDVSIDYIHPNKKITSQYLVDMLVEYFDGTKKLIEIKPEKMLENSIVQAKIESAKIKASELGYEFEVWTEMDLFGHVYNKKNMNLFIEKIRNGEI
jgi:hypothetical protein